MLFKKRIQIAGMSAVQVVMKLFDHFDRDSDNSIDEGGPDLVDEHAQHPAFGSFQVQSWLSDTFLDQRKGRMKQFEVCDASCASC